MVVGFEKLVKTVRSRAWRGLYTIIAKAGRAWRDNCGIKDWKFPGKVISDKVILTFNVAALNISVFCLFLSLRIIVGIRAMSLVSPSFD